MVMHRMMYKIDTPHLYIRDGVYYFVRRIPVDIQSYYSSNRISFSLKTKSLATANRAIKSINQRLDDYWLGLRLQKIDIPAISVLKIDGLSDSDNSPTLSDALSLYLSLKGAGKDKVFVRTANRNIEYVIQVLGDKPIASYSSSDAAKFRDWLIDKGMNIKTVKRVFSSVRAIVNIAITEKGVDCINGFAKTYFPEEINVSERKPISIEAIKYIQKLCREEDDELRWLIGLISDTGMRLGEAVGLLKEDINLHHEIPHITLIPHSWRGLKTKGSKRLIPLVGASLWAATRVLESNNQSVFAFPRYCNEKTANANSASGALNKWLQENTSSEYVIHGFRHSLRDRLRAVECPSDIVDMIGGWHTAGVGQTYGNGYPLDVLNKWMRKVLIENSSQTPKFVLHDSRTLCQ